MADLPTPKNEQELTTHLIVQALQDSLDSITQAQMDKVAALAATLPDNVTVAEWVELFQEVLQDIVVTGRLAAANTAAATWNDTIGYTIDHAIIKEAGVVKKREIEKIITQALKAAAAGENQIQSATSALVGEVQLAVLNGSRQYTYDYCEKNDIALRIHTRPDACAWCRYIAVQHFEYDDVDWAMEKVNLKVGARQNLFHPNCWCSYVPADAYFPGPEIAGWQRQISRARKGNGSDYKEMLKVMRRIDKAVGGQGK